MSESSRPDAWLIEASRQLSPPSADIDRLVAAITAKVRLLPLPSTPLDTDLPGVTITDLVLKQLLATEIRRDYERLVVAIRLDIHNRKVRRVRINLIGRYRDELPELGDVIRQRVKTILMTGLGADHGARAANRIDLHWTDLHDPR